MQFLHELDDLGALLEEDFAELLDFALLLEDFAELLVMADEDPPSPLLLLDFGVTLEEDFAEELDSREELLVDTLVELELDCGVTLE